MKRVLVTQRVYDNGGRGAERRDALDQKWCDFLLRCGVEPVIVPNNIEYVRTCLKGAYDGLLLTGGDSLVAYGGQAPERDAVERLLLAQAIDRKIPVIGVCRGMQLLQSHFGISLHRVSGHAGVNCEVVIDGRPTLVNSYHEWGTTQSSPDLHVWASATDGVVKAVRHSDGNLLGIMWHPERMRPYQAEDVALFQAHFGCTIEADQSL